MSSTTPDNCVGFTNPEEIGKRIQAKPAERKSDIFRNCQIGIPFRTQHVCKILSTSH